MRRESDARDALVFWAGSLFERGLTSGSSGNMSLRLGDGWLITPTNCCLGALKPEDPVLVDSDWRVRGCGVPSKEWPMHAAMYAARPDAAAVVHLHSVHAVAVSCLDDLNPEDVLPALTPYFVMRVAPLAIAPYRPPGDASLADDIRRLAIRSHAVLLRNHGTIIAGTTLEAALFAAEELEEAAKLKLLLRGQSVRTLTPEQVSLLRELFPA